MAQIYPDFYSAKRSFISPAAFHIINRVCDSLILLALAYSKYYPDQPFCPWLFGTEFVEHFFGLARMILPDFTYAEFLKMVNHIMVRQRILLLGTFSEKREKQSGVGYDLDFDATPLSPEEARAAVVSLSVKDIDELAELGYKEAEMICKDLLKISVPALNHEKPLQLSRVGVARTAPFHYKDSDDDEPEEDALSDDEDYDDGVDESSSEAIVAAAAALGTSRLSALCDDYDATVAELRTAPAIVPQVLLVPTCARLLSSTQDHLPVTLKSDIIDGDGMISIERICALRRRLQSGTKVKSERAIRLDPKFALRKTTDELTNEEDDTPPKRKMTTQEASQRVRVVQALAHDVERDIKARAVRWRGFAKALEVALSQGHGARPDSIKL